MNSNGIVSKSCRLSVITVALLWLCGCQTLPERGPQQINHLFYDEGFLAVELPVAPDTMLALPEAAQQLVRQAYHRDLELSRLTHSGRFSGRRSNDAHNWLGRYINAASRNQAVYSSALSAPSEPHSRADHRGVAFDTQVPDKMAFRYRDNLTQGAAKTFASREGNCLSLVLMTAALAQTLGVKVTFQQLDIEPTWDRAGTFYLINGHINIKLLPPKRHDVISLSQSSVLVDFLPQRAIRGYRRREIDLATVSAMFYNNLAAEALVAGQLDNAYVLVKRSLFYQADFVPGLNTLGVIYRHAGMDTAAEQVYRHVLDFAPQSLNVLSNLALLLSAQNRLSQWSEVHRTLELIRLKNPFYYYDMAQLAYREQRYRKAQTLYRRAIVLADYRAEFFFGLAQTYWQLQQPEKARSQMKKALSLSQDPHQRQQYQSKLRAIDKAMTAKGAS